MVNKLAESSLKRFLKRKVKVTLGLVVAFLITGSIGYADYEIKDNKEIISNESINLVENSTKGEAGIINTNSNTVLITTSSGDINFSVTAKGIGYGINSKGSTSKQDDISLNSAGKIEINVSSSNARAEGISSFNHSKINLQAKDDIVINSKNSSESKPEGIILDSTITYGLHYDVSNDYNNDSENDNIKIQSEKNILIDASSNLGTTFGMYNKHGKITLDSGKDITIKSTVNEIFDDYNLTNQSAGIYSSDGQITLKSAENINIIAESKVTHTNGISLATTKKDTLVEWKNCKYNC